MKNGTETKRHYLGVDKRGKHLFEKVTRRIQFCGKCKNEYLKKYMKERYRKDKTFREKHLKRVKKKVSERQRRILLYLSKHPCVDCGEDDVLVLEFDHVRGKKLYGVASMKHSHPWKMIAKEIRKCEVRCANCHRRRTAVMRGSYRLKEG